MLPKLHSSNIQNVLTLILGVGSSQVIGILAMFAYTRIYEPQHLGLLGMFLSFVVILRMLSNGGYEVTIVLPESDRAACDLLNLCFLLNILTVFASCILVLAAEQLITFFYSDTGDNLRQVIWLLPFSVLFEAGTAALKYWLNRFKKYKTLSLARFLQAIITVILTLYLGWEGFLVYGLIVGLVVGQGVQWLVMLLGSELPKYWQWNFQSIQQMAKQYRQFLQYGVLGTWFNSLASEVPFLILPRFFGEAVTGLFHVARKVLFAPINLVGSSISTVYYEQASKAHQLGSPHLANLSKNTLRYMLLMSVVPSIILFFLGEEIFAIAFGEAYRTAGLYASWLIPWILVKFLSHPLTYLIDIKFKLKAQLFYNIILFLGQAGILIFCGLLLFSPLSTIMAYGMVGLVLSGIYLIFLLQLAELV